MAELERRIKKQIRNTKIKRAILQCIATAGVLSVALIAPNALSMFSKLGILKHKSDYDKKRSISSSRYRLEKLGYIKYDSGHISLTNKGQEILNKLELNDYSIIKPKKWDNKWRMVIFDIKEYRRQQRDDLRRILRQIGFLRLQNSVWVYPYECEDLVNLIKTDFKMGKEVLYIIADQIENDLTIKRHFELV